MKNTELVAKLKDVATNHKTLYVMGCFGAPMTAANKTRYCNNHDYNKDPERTAMIKAASADTFGFDCVCLVKGVLWGWSGDKSKTYGGASYQANGVPDINADTIITKCSAVSTTGWDKLVPGELLWMKGHVGVYVGDGLAVECTPRWSNDVQITAVHNIGTKAGYNGRKWTKHGKLPYVEYVEEVKPVPVVTGTPSTGSAADEKVIWDFLKGKGLNDYAVAGLMGNLNAESALRSNNLQQTYERKLGYTDDSYTKAVDDGSYGNFVRDSAGYGLAQWTYWSRKENLLKFAQAAKKSICDFQMQLDFLWKELQGYSSVMSVLKSATSVREASDVVLVKFEAPADQGEAMKAKRAGYGQKYYDKYAVKPVAPKPVEPAEPVPLKVGDIVEFTGKTHYTSANAKVGPACKPGKAKVTGIYKTGKHPYHLVRVTGGGSTVWGWVDAADIAGLAVEEEKPWVPAVGDTVTYNGNTHYVSSNSNLPKPCKGGKAKITGIYRTGKHPYHLVRVAGSGATVYGWVDANSFTKG